LLISQCGLMARYQFNEKHCLKEQDEKKKRWWRRSDVHLWSPNVHSNTTHEVEVEEGFKMCELTLSMEFQDCSTYLPIML
jgi:hypothetical protein